MAANVINASFFEQAGATAQPVTLQVMAGMLWIKTGEVIERRAALTDLKVATIRGSGRKLTLPDGTWCELSAQPGLVHFLEQLQGRPDRPVRRNNGPSLQALKGALVTALLVLAAAAVAMMAWGLPHLAARIAADTPAPLRAQISQRILAALDADGTLTPSVLPEARRLQIGQDFAALKFDTDTRAPLLFRASKALGAGVLTLPDGRLVLLDRSVSLALNSQQLTALLAHSQAHAQAGQVLQLMYQQAPLAVGRSWWAGDNSELLALAPGLFLQLRYPHEQEREADIRAAHLLAASSVPPSRLAEILELLLAADRDLGEEGGTTLYMDVHPATDLRARALRNGNF